MYENINKKHQKKLAEIIGKYKEVNKFDYLYKAADELNEYFEEDLKMEGWKEGDHFPVNEADYIWMGLF